MGGQKVLGESAARQTISRQKSLNQSYEYIIAGGGCAGLSLLCRMADDPFFTHKRILLIDQQLHRSHHDKTWCFWEKNTGYFDEIVFHEWPKLWVKHPFGNLDLKLDGYRYKMIRSGDLYRHAYGKLSVLQGLTMLQGSVSDIIAEQGSVVTDQGKFTAATWVFTSIPAPAAEPAPHDIALLQHFKGWWIETAEDVFDPQQADLMNFCIPQRLGCAFMYVLPYTSRKALVEYTFFNEALTTDDVYDQGLQQFIEGQLGIRNYRVQEVEKGVIPMTTQRFPSVRGKVVHMGTSGGYTKPSSGYTFQYIQKHAQAIIEDLKAGRLVADYQQPWRFNFYDGVLLRVLHERKMPGADVFFNLFRKNPPARVLRFLDNETRLSEELLIMNSSPFGVFVPAAWQQLRQSQSSGSN